ncbi:hypothetical protein [Lacticaseibacillus songhuajiangensis]|jgi:hypothetical protein|uniref:hypothetical protein n=1 Tax=Lacticaseibacillus songhuajiangensis TaxID=1296539 RepID=UPI000F79F75F|nr:hypothetical protein [Lacticaseibacillus songhuajiangensis]
MAITFESASVIYTFVDPLDPKQTKHNHILNNLVENPDEDKLAAIGEEFKLLLPNMTLTKITISTDATLDVAVASAPAPAEESGTTTTPDSGDNTAA